MLYFMKSWYEQIRFPKDEIIWFPLQSAPVHLTKAELPGVGIFFLIHLFARAILSLKKLKIEETKAT